MGSHSSRLATCWGFTDSSRFPASRSPACLLAPAADCCVCESVCNESSVSCSFPRHLTQASLAAANSGSGGPKNRLGEAVGWFKGLGQAASSIVGAGGSRAADSAEDPEYIKVCVAAGGTIACTVQYPTQGSQQDADAATQGALRLCEHAVCKGISCMRSTAWKMRSPLPKSNTFASPAHMCVGLQHCSSWARQSPHCGTSVWPLAC